MGNNILQTNKLQQAIQFQRFIQQKFFVQMQNSRDQKQNTQWLIERSTGLQYVLKKLQTNSQAQGSMYNEIITRKVKQNCESVTPLQDFHVQRVKETCNVQITYYLFFKIGRLSALTTELMRRTQNKEQFTQTQLLEGIKNCGKAISWQKSVYRQNNSHANWKICPQNIFYHNGSFCLSDPWISFFSAQQTLKYSSPERLLLMADEIDEIDWGASQMFAIAMAFLEAAKLGKMRKIYEKNKINLEALRQEIGQCNYPKLKQLLKNLLLKGPEKRRQYLNNLQGSGYVKQKQKIMRFQKYKMLDKVQSSKKIKLTKNTNNQNTITTLLPTSKQINSQTILADSLRQPLQVYNINQNRLPQIRFNYIPYLNKVRLELKPIDQEISSVHKCIQSINRNLASIQSFVSQKIYSQDLSNALQNVAQSKIVQEASRKQERELSEADKKSLTEYYKVEMPQTHTEQSEAKMSRQQLEKDSLHVLMEQFRIEEQNGLTQSFNEANYTVNINPAKSQTPEPVFKQEKEESSLEIVNQPLDDTNGYIFKMQGTQLQAVSKLTIPQQQAEEEQSFQQGLQKVPKGQYVVRKHEKGGVYKGYIYNNKRNGLGTFIYLEGGYYEGNWKDNKMNGYGKIYYDSGELAYQGLWYQDQIHGRGKLYNDSPQPLQQPFNYKNFQHENYHLYELSYQGDFSHDLKEGFGKLILSNGEFYSGQFHENNPHGKGYFNGQNFSIYGQWQNGKFIKAL